MNLDNYESKINKEKTLQYDSLKKKELELYRQYSNLYESGNIISKKNEFKSQLIHEFKNHFEKRDYSVTDNNGEITAKKIDVIITLKNIIGYEFALQFGVDYRKRYRYIIELWNEFPHKRKNNCFIDIDRIGYIGQSKNTETDSYVIKSIANIEEDKKDLSEVLTNTNNIKFALLSSGDNKIEGEFYTIDELIKAIPE